MPQDLWFPDMANSMLEGRIFDQTISTEDGPKTFIVAEVRVHGKKDSTAYRIDDANKAAMQERFPGAWAVYSGEDVIPGPDATPEPLAGLMVDGSPIDAATAADLLSRDIATFDDILKMSFADVLAVCGVPLTCRLAAFLADRAEPAA